MMTPEQIEKTFKETVIHALYLHSHLTEAGCRQLAEAICHGMKRHGITLADTENVPCGTKRAEQNAEWFPQLELMGDVVETAIETVRRMQDACARRVGITLSHPELASIALHLHTPNNPPNEKKHPTREIQRRPDPDSVLERHHQRAHAAHNRRKTPAHF